MRHVPSGASGGRGWKLLDRLLDAEIPGDVRHQIADRREGVHGLDDHRHVQVQLAQPRHAHQLRHAVDLRRAGAAFARLAVPAHGEIGRLLGLNAVYGVQHHHAFDPLASCNPGTRRRFASPRQIRKQRLRRAIYFISSITAFNSAGIGGMGRFSTTISPLVAARAPRCCTCPTPDPCPGSLREIARRGSPYAAARPA